METASLLTTDMDRSLVVSMRGVFLQLLLFVWGTATLLVRDSGVVYAVGVDFAEIVVSLCCGT